MNLTEFCTSPGHQLMNQDHFDVGMSRVLTVAKKCLPLQLSASNSQGRAVLQVGKHQELGARHPAFSLLFSRLTPKWHTESFELACKCPPFRYYNPQAPVKILPCYMDLRFGQSKVFKWMRRILLT